MLGAAPMAHGEALPFRLQAPKGAVRWCRGIALGRPNVSKCSGYTGFILLWLGEYQTSIKRAAIEQHSSYTPNSPLTNPSVLEAVADFLRRISPELAEARSDEVARLVYESCERMVPVASLPAICLNKLTFRELEICAAVTSGKSTKQIAKELSISTETIRTTRKNIRRKLGLKMRRQSLYSFLKSA
jgi:DNA-binding NarL/FixJ family response regulator